MFKAELVYAWIKMSLVGLIHWKCFPPIKPALELHKPPPYSAYVFRVIQQEGIFFHVIVFADEPRSFLNYECL